MQVIYDARYTDASYICYNNWCLITDASYKQKYLEYYLEILITATNANETEIRRLQVTRLSYKVSIELKFTKRPTKTHLLIQRCECKSDDPANRHLSLKSALLKWKMGKRLLTT